GMGPGFISPNLDRTLIDDILTIDLDDAERECQRLAREEGILVGQSSGAASLAARQVAKRVSDPSATCPEPPTAMSDGGSDRCPLVLTVFWDSGERYLSAGTFERNTN
ncbi:MAG: cysteine synthase, partial [Halobacteriaceae archaeon]